MAAGFDLSAFGQDLMGQIQAVQKATQDAFQQAVTANATVSQAMVSGSPIPSPDDLSLITKILNNPELKARVVALAQTPPVSATGQASPAPGHG